MRIKDWEQFQHFKDRTPPWIKLYRYLLDDPNWHSLSGRAAKTLVMLWLVASEDKKKNGNLPDVSVLAFRLRVKEDYLIKCLQELSHFLIQHDITPISSCYQHDAPETETETETEGETETELRMSEVKIDFSDFWKIYPKKKSRDTAERAWKKLDVDAGLFEKIKTALDWQKETQDWRKDKGQYIPYPATYLNGARWNDERVDTEKEEWERGLI